MLLFELKKLWKSRLMIVLIFFALCAPLFVQMAKMYDVLPRYVQTDMDADAFTRLSIEKNRKKSLNFLDAEESPKNSTFYQKWMQLEKIYHSLKEERKSVSESSLSAYEEKYYGFWRSFAEVLKKYGEEEGIQLTEKEQQRLSWLLFEGKYLREYGTHSVSVQSELDISSLMNRLIFFSDILFGFPVVLLFLLLFCGIYSGEYESGTLYFLATQPFSRFRMIVSKVGALLLMAAGYVFLTVLSIAFWCKWQKISLVGWDDIYRVFGSGLENTYIPAWHFLLKIIGGFLLLMSLFSSCILYISTRAKKTWNTLVWCSFGAAFLWILSENVSFLQNPWNPMYALDYVRAITGKLEFVTMPSGVSGYQMRFAYGLLPYLCFGFCSVLLLFFSAFPVHESEKSLVRENRGKGVSSIGAFEGMKITKNHGFITWFCGIILLLFLFFLFPTFMDRNWENSLYGKEGPLVSLEKDYQELKEKLDYLKTPEGQSKLYPLIRVDEDDSGTPRKTKPIEQWTKVEQDGYRLFMDSFQENVDTAKANMQSYRERIRSYNENDGRKYYESMLEEAKMLVIENDGYRTTHLKGGAFSKYTGDETHAVLKAAYKNNVNPMVRTSIFPSERESYVSFNSRMKLQRVLFPRSHSSFFALYRMMRIQHLDIILLIILGMIVFGGYVFDKETGRQLEFLYTEPVRRTKYHWTKIGIAVLHSVGLLAIVYFFVFLLGGVTEGIGAWNFPIVYYTHGRFQLIDLWHYLLRVFLVIVAECFFLSSLSTFLSIFVKEKNRLLAGLALVVGGGVFLSGYLPQGLIRLLSPFHYLQASTVANGSVKIFRNLPQESFWASILILVVWGVILGITGAQVVKKRECV